MTAVLVMFRSEVSDAGSGVGTAVKRTPTLLGAVHFVSVTARESWAGEWRIIDTATGSTIIRSD